MIGRLRGNLIEKQEKPSDPSGLDRPKVAENELIWLTKRVAESYKAQPSRVRITLAAGENRTMAHWLRRKQDGSV